MKKRTYTDFDNNVFTSIVIGDQEWMAENLKVTHYKDGTVIPHLVLDGNWNADLNGAYCWYDNDAGNEDDYGALYNWHAVNNAHGLAPEGWRIPTVGDVNTLAAYLGGVGVAGGELKERGLVHWDAPNEGASDSSEFSARGGGVRFNAGNFGLLKSSGSFWSDTSLNGFYVSKDNTTMVITGGFNNTQGLSVRCVRDI